MDAMVIDVETEKAVRQIVGKALSSVAAGLVHEFGDERQTLLAGDLLRHCVGPFQAGDDAGNRPLRGGFLKQRTGQ
jgi:hypothetical protein